MKYESSVPKSEKPTPSFEVQERRGGEVSRYTFTNVVVTIDRSGRNVPGVSELTFGTYDYDASDASLDQPDFRRKNVDMEHVVACVMAAVRDSGERVFWINPYDGDAKEGEEKNRAEARARLFGKNLPDGVSLVRNPDGPGFFLSYE